MALRDELLPEFDSEMASTRRALERIPDDKLGWKPHEKSWTMGGLCTHLANLPMWTNMTIEKDALDIAPAGEAPYREEEVKSSKELLEKFDQNVTAARAALSAVSDEHLMKKWTLLAGGREILSRPRVAILRDFIFSHTIHHRGQLTVYLRLNDIPVPAIYGPSADEDGM